MATAPVALSVIQLVLAAEPEVVQAIHNILSGKGSADDLATLKADSIAWQAIADHAAAQIEKLNSSAKNAASMPVAPGPR